MQLTYDISSTELATQYAKIQHLNELKSKFITSVSHEFRTPMAVMQSALMLANYYQSKGECERIPAFLSQIEESMHHLNDLIDSITSINLADDELSASQLESLDLHQIAETLKNKMLQ